MQALGIRPSHPNLRRLQHFHIESRRARNLRRFRQQDRDKLLRVRQRQARLERVLRRVHGEFRGQLVGEDVVVDAVADRAADGAHGQRQRGRCGDQDVGRDEQGDGGGGHDHAADTEGRDRRECDRRLGIVWRHAGEGAAEGGHDNRRGEEHFAVAVWEGGKGGVEADGADGGGDCGGEALEADLDGVVGIDIGPGEG